MRATIFLFIISLVFIKAHSQIPNQLKPTKDVYAPFQIDKVSDLESDYQSLKNNPGYIVTNHQYVNMVFVDFPLEDVRGVYYEIYGNEYQRNAFTLHILEFKDQNSLQENLKYTGNLNKYLAMYKDQYLILISKPIFQDQYAVFNSFIFYYSNAPIKANIYNRDRKAGDIEDEYTQVGVDEAEYEVATVEAMDGVNADDIKAAADSIAEIVITSNDVTEATETTAVEIVEADSDEDHTKKLDPAIEKLKDEAYEYLDKRDFEKAIPLFQRLITNNPKEESYYYNIAWMYVHQDKFQDAINISKQGLRNVPKEEFASLYKMIGNANLELKNYDTGIHYLQKSLKINGDEVVAIHNLGYAYFMFHKYDKAIFWLWHCIDMGYGNEEDLDDVWFYIGTSYAQLGRHEMSIPYYDEALKTTKYYSYYTNKSLAQSKLGLHEAAITTLNEGLENFPNNGAIYFSRYQIYNDLEEVNKMYPDLLKACELMPNDPDVLLDMGVMYHKKNEMGNANKMYQLALDHGVEPDLVYANIGNIYSDNKLTYDSAAYYYQKAIKVNPAKPEHYYNFGNFYKKSEMYEMAIKQYQKAMELKPDFILAYNNMGVVYRRLKNDEKAKEIFLKIIETAPNDYEINANLLGIALEENNYEDVEKYATKSIDNIPKGTSKLPLLNYRGIARLMNGKPQDALYDYLDIANNLHSDEMKNNSSVFSNIGFCYVEMDDATNAEKYFMQALNLEREPDALIGLMITSYMKGQTVMMNEYKSQAISLEPKLAKGVAGIKELIDDDGYAFTKKQKDMLEKILAQKD